MLCEVARNIFGLWLWVGEMDYGRKTSLSSMAWLRFDWISLDTTIVSLPPAGHLPSTKAVYYKVEISDEYLLTASNATIRWYAAQRLKKCSVH